MSEGTFTSASPSSALTLDDFEKAIDLVFPKLFYATAEFVERGAVIYCKETKLSPEYIIINPLDLDEVRTNLPNRRLVHVRKYKPDYTKLAKMIGLEMKIDYEPKT